MKNPTARLLLLCLALGSIAQAQTVPSEAPTRDQIVSATKSIERDERERAARWKEEWAGFYKNRNHGDDYLLIRVTPSRLEVVSPSRGLDNDPDTWRPVILNLR